MSYRVLRYRYPNSDKPSRLGAKKKEMLGGYSDSYCEVILYVPQVNMLDDLWKRTLLRNIRYGHLKREKSKQKTEWRILLRLLFGFELIIVQFASIFSVQVLFIDPPFAPTAFPVSSLRLSGSSR